MMAMRYEKKTVVKNVNCGTIKKVAGKGWMGWWN
jgi:hypothetical protein